MMPEKGGGLVCDANDDGLFWKNLKWASPPPQPSRPNSPVMMGKKEGGKKKRRRGGEGGGGDGDDKMIKEGSSVTTRSDNTKARVEVKEGEQSEHEIHIWTERERRKKMRNMFSSLHALLPQLPPKADKSTIVDEAVSYIKTLQQSLQTLEKQKLERLQGVANSGFDHHHQQQQGSLSVDNCSNNKIRASRSDRSTDYPAVIFQTWTSSNVVLNICGDEAQISICSPKDKPGICSTICYVLEKHKIEVVSAHVSTDFTRRLFMIQAHVTGAWDHQLTEALPVEEVYKQAATELMVWISS